MVAVESRGGGTGEPIYAEKCHVTESGGAEEGADFWCGEGTDL